MHMWLGAYLAMVSGKQKGCTAGPADPAAPPSSGAANMPTFSMQCG